MKKHTTIGAIFDLYIESEVVSAGLSKNTYEGYSHTKKLAIEFFGNVQIEYVRAEDVRDFYTHLVSWQKPDTARGHIVSMRAVLRYCARKGLKVMDTEDIKVPRRQKRLVKYLTETEVRNFIIEVGRKRRGYAKINRVRNVVLVELLYATGLRIGEACRLNRNSIRNRQFTVIGKSKNPRICFITPKVEQLIKKYIAIRVDSNPALFISNMNNKRITPGGIQRVFRFVCNRSEFHDVTPHTIRHSFATRLLEREVDIRYIGELLGHESLDTTKMYTHFSNPKLRRIYDMANL